ncbi:MAG: endolytic transglycosylase MltG, partial [Bacteroidota bacterium]
MARRKSKKQLVNPTSIAVSVATAVGFIILASVVWMNAALRPVSHDTTTRLVKIDQRGTKALGMHLKREGLIRNGTAFRLLAKTNMALGKCPAPKAGFYDLSPSMSSEEILDRICAGKTAKRKVTFPEGFTLRQMGERLEERMQVPAAEFAKAARGSRVERALPFRLPPGSLEGYLFPTTYSLPVGEKPEFVVSEMVASFNEFFYKPNKAAIAASPLKLNEIVTLASLVEREARVASERPTIAGVLVNRLNKGMRLQCDASVQYALGNHKARLTF